MLKPNFAQAVAISLSQPKVSLFSHLTTSINVLKFLDCKDALNITVPHIIATINMAVMQIIVQFILSPTPIFRINPSHYACR